MTPKELAQRRRDRDQVRQIRDSYRRKFVQEYRTKNQALLDQIERCLQAPSK